MRHTQDGHSAGPSSGSVCVETIARLGKRTVYKIGWSACAKQVVLKSYEECVQLRAHLMDNHLPLPCKERYRCNLKKTQRENGNSNNIAKFVEALTCPGSPFAKDPLVSNFLYSKNQAAPLENGSELSSSYADVEQVQVEVEPECKKCIALQQQLDDACQAVERERDLVEIERRELQNAWMRSAELEKKFQDGLQYAISTSIAEARRHEHELLKVTRGNNVAETVCDMQSNDSKRHATCYSEQKHIACQNNEDNPEPSCENDYEHCEDGDEEHGILTSKQSFDSPQTIFGCSAMKDVDANSSEERPVQAEVPVVFVFDGSSDMLKSVPDESSLANTRTGSSSTGSHNSKADTTLYSNSVETTNTSEVLGPIENAYINGAVDVEMQSCCSKQTDSDVASGVFDSVANSDADEIFISELNTASSKLPMNPSFCAAADTKAQQNENSEVDALEESQEEEIVFGSDMSGINDEVVDKRSTEIGKTCEGTSIATSNVDDKGVAAKSDFKAALQKALSVRRKNLNISKCAQIEHVGAVLGDEALDSRTLHQQHSLFEVQSASMQNSLDASKARTKNDLGPVFPGMLITELMARASKQNTDKKAKASTLPSARSMSKKRNPTGNEIVIEGMPVLLSSLCYESEFS